MFRGHRTHRAPGSFVPALAITFLAFACASGHGTPPASTASSPPASADPASPGLGINLVFLNLPGLPAPDKGHATDAEGNPLRGVPADDAWADLQDLGVGTVRHFDFADTLWTAVEPSRGTFRFDYADRVFPTAPLRVVATLFDPQFTTAAPPWAREAGDRWEPVLGADARDYVAAAVARYADHVQYWEIGNEMDHWRAARNGGRLDGKVPANTPREGWSPRDQGLFLAAVAEVIRANDPDAKIVMPGLSRLDDYAVDEWLTGVVAGAGADTFDVVGYHFYSPWSEYPAARAHLARVLSETGMAGKPVWLTETGTSSDPTLTQRTDYPNDETAQAADVWRRFALAFGHGDALATWHTYVDSPGTADNNPWRQYGLRRLADKSRKPSWHAYKIFAHEVVPFAKVAIVEEGPRYVVAFDRADGGRRWVVWGKGSWTVPDGATRAVPADAGASDPIPWAPVAGALELGPVPRLVATP
jgi:hypothetical protein